VKAAPKAKNHGRCAEKIRAAAILFCNWLRTFTRKKKRLYSNREIHKMFNFLSGKYYFFCVK